MEYLGMKIILGNVSEPVIVSSVEPQIARTIKRSLISRHKGPMVINHADVEALARYIIGLEARASGGE